MTSAPKTFVRLCARKPVGGSILLTVHQLCLLWWFYRTRHLELLNVRVWRAAHEMVARRCTMAPGQIPQYTLPALHGLVGGGKDRCRAALGLLTTVSCVTTLRLQTPEGRQRERRRPPPSLAASAE